MHDSVATVSREFWLKQALKKAETMLADGIIPLPDDDHVERFLVEDIQAKIEGEISDSHMLLSKNLSIISEGLICDLINQGLIFGSNATARKTNQYDDYINHVDLLVELPDCPITRFGIDVTYSNSLEKKLDRIKKSIANGKLSNLKYGPEGCPDTIPMFLLGFDQRNLCELGRQWIEKPVEVTKSGKLDLLLLQFEKQLEIYATYASTHNQFIVHSLLKQLERYWNTLNCSGLRTFYKDKVTDAIVIELRKFSH